MSLREVMHESYASGFPKQFHRQNHSKLWCDVHVYRVYLDLGPLTEQHTH